MGHYNPEPCWCSGQGVIQKPMSMCSLDCSNFEFLNGTLSLNAPLLAISVPSDATGDPLFVSLVLMTSYDRVLGSPDVVTQQWCLLSLCARRLSASPPPLAGTHV